MADQEMSWSLNPLPYHLMLVDVGLSTRRNLNRERARGYTSIRPGTPSREPGYAHMHPPQHIYDAAFVRGSARPARCQGARIQPLSTGVPSKSLRAYAHARYRG